jgi:cytidine deaminase
VGVGFSMLTDTVRQQLLDRARRAREHAYAPYSNFKVGAAVLTAAGEIFSGCNIENASLGATICAERVAIFTAVAAGHRDLTALAVIADTPDPVAPCGLCRQVLAEFSPDCRVLMANTAGRIRLANLKELLPLPFRLPNGSAAGAAKPIQGGEK